MVTLYAGDFISRSDCTFLVSLTRSMQRQDIISTKKFEIEILMNLNVLDHFENENLIFGNYIYLFQRSKTHKCIGLERRKAACDIYINQILDEIPQWRSCGVFMMRGPFLAILRQTHIRQW